MNTALLSRLDIHMYVVLVLVVLGSISLGQAGKLNQQFFIN